jgi:AcrR family transcriptional regulator
MLHTRSGWVTLRFVTEAAVAPELIDAVEQVLTAHGWSGTTAELIAEAAGLNRVTLYRRGLTKERLLAAAALAAGAEFQAAALPCLVSAGTARDRLTALISALCDLADRHLALLAGLYDGPSALFHMGGKPDDPTALTRLEYTAPFERLLHDGNTDGTLTSPRPSEDAELIFNMAGWTYVHLRRTHQWTPERAREAVTRVSTAYVAPQRIGEPDEHRR